MADSYKLAPEPLPFVPSKANTYRDAAIVSIP